MVFGVISIIAGAIVFIVILVKDIATVQQQTVQYLGFIWASLLIIGGAVMIMIQNGFASLETRLINDTKQDKPAEPSTPSINTIKAGVLGSTWQCKKCFTDNPATSNSCKSCGEYR